MLLPSPNLTMAGCGLCEQLYKGLVEHLLHRCPPFCEVSELVQQHMPPIYQVQLKGLKGPNHPLRFPLEGATSLQCFTKVSHSTIWNRGLQVNTQRLTINLDCGRSIRHACKQPAGMG